MYIGIDLGTTGCKVIMYGGDGEPLNEFNKEYELICDGGFVEQNADDWQRLVFDGIRTVVRQSGVTAVRGISVSTQGISFVPVDACGTPLANAVTWLDLRASEERNALLERFGDRCIFEKTGKHCEADYTLPKLMWLKKHKPEIYEKADKLLMPLDFINQKLTGIPLTDYTCAGGTMLYNICEKRWDSELLDFSGVDEEKLPPVGCIGDKVGELLPQVADELGIEPGCTVYLGGQDQKLAAIGAGIDKNSCTVSFGTATAISKLEDKPDFDCSAPHFAFTRDGYIAEASVMTTGASLRWLARSVFGGLSYREMDELALQSVPGANGVVFKPDLSAGGVISGLSLATTRSDIVYALYEGVCAEIAELIRSLGGAERLLVFGGGAKSDIWCEILARVSTADVYVLNTTETAALGAAIIASGGKIPSAGIKKVINSDKYIRFNI